MKHYPLTFLFMAALVAAMIAVTMQDKHIEQQRKLIELKNRAITLQDSLVWKLKKKIEILESKLKPESAILQGSFDGVHWDTIGICQVENTKYVRVKIVPDCKPAKQ